MRNPFRHPRAGGDPANTLRATTYAKRLIVYSPSLWCLLAGSLMTLSFAPFNWGILALFLPAVLCAAWVKASPRQAFARGWLFGFGWALTGGSWIYVSIHRYGGDNAVAAAGVCVLVAALLALYPAVQGYLLARWLPRSRHLKTLLAFPATWVIAELLRSTLFTGVPWLLLGNTQINSPFAGFAPVFSVYGVSLMVALVNALLVTYFQSIVTPRSFARAHLSDSPTPNTALAPTKQRSFPRKHFRQYLALIAILSLALLGSGLQHIHWTHPSAKPIQVTLVQGNIPQQTKWDPGENQIIANTYFDLTKTHWQSPIIIWPESALPVFADEAQLFLQPLSELATEHHSAIIMGIPLENEAGTKFYNGAIALGDGRGEYRKHHLVPFGEYIPLQHWLGGLLEFLTLPMTGWTPGPTVQPLMEVQHLKVAVFICYESAFPLEVRAQWQNAAFLVTLSDDGWFGDSIGPAQHEQIDQMRALETGRYLLRSTNNGATSIINPQGLIMARAPENQATTLTATITPMRGQTPWLHFGIYPLLLILLVMLLAAGGWRRRGW